MSSVYQTGNNKMQMQAIFWESMMDKYEERNNMLRKQQCDLRQRLEAMGWSPNSLQANEKSSVSNSNQCGCNKYHFEYGDPPDTSSTGNVTEEPQKDASPEKSMTSMKSALETPQKSTSSIKKSISSMKSATERLPSAVCTTSNTNNLQDCSQNAKSTSGRASIKMASHVSVTAPATATTEVQQRSSVHIKAPRLPSPIPPIECACSEIIHEPDRLSLFSIASDDLLCMQRLVDLKEREKKLKAEMEELAQQEKIFMEMKSATPAYGTGFMGGMGMMGMGMNMVNEQGLTKELNDARKELQMCIDRIEGPMALQLECEKSKSKQLEQQLLEITRAIEESKKSFQREMNELKMQLHCTCANLYDVTSKNTDLKDELSTLGCRCRELEDDLIHQKLSEAETLRRLSQSRGNDPCTCACSCISKSYTQPIPPPPPPPVCTCVCSCHKDAEEDNSLYAIARKLSQSLLDTEKCLACKTSIPPDLRDTVQGIKSLVELVDKHSQKFEESKLSGGSPPPSPPPEPPLHPEESTPTSSIHSTTDIILKDTSLHSETEVIIESGSPSKGSTKSKEPSVKSLPEAKTPSKRSSQVSRESEHSSKEPSKRSSRESSKRASRESSRSSSKGGSRRASREASVKSLEKTLSREPSVAKSIIKDASRTSQRSRVSLAEKPIELGTQAVPSVCSAKLPTSESHVCGAGQVAQVQVAESKEIVESSVGEGMALVEEIGITVLEEPQSALVLAKKSSVKIQEKDMEEAVEVKTEIEAFGDMDVEVDTEVDILDTAPEGVHVTTTITGSGTLEVITEGPAGIIETTMTYTESGNIEVLTEITEFEDTSEAIVAKPSRALSYQETPSEKSKERLSTVRISLPDVKESLPSTTSSAEKSVSRVSSVSREKSVTSKERLSSASSRSREPSSGKISSTAAEESISGVTSESSAFPPSGTSITASHEVSVSAVTSDITVSQESKFTVTPESVSRVSSSASALKKESSYTESETMEDVKSKSKSSMSGRSGSITSKPSSKSASVEAKPSIKSAEAQESVCSAMAKEPSVCSAMPPEKSASGVSEAAKPEELPTEEIVEERAKSVASETVEVTAEVEEDEKVEIPPEEAAEVTSATTEESKVSETVEVGSKSSSRVRIAEPEVEAEEFAPEEAIPEEGEEGKEGEEGEETKTPTEISADVEVEGEKEEFEEAEGEEEKEGGEEKEEEEEEESDLDTDDLRKGVAEALNKANQDVMNALEQANKDVTDALEKANKDVEAALALAIQEKSSKTSKTSKASLKSPASGATVTESAEFKSSISLEKPESMLSAQECADHTSHEASNMYEGLVGPSDAEECQAIKAALTPPTEETCKGVCAADALADEVTVIESPRKTSVVSTSTDERKQSIVMDQEVSVSLEEGGPADIEVEQTIKVTIEQPPIEEKAASSKEEGPPREEEEPVSAEALSLATPEKTSLHEEEAKVTTPKEPSLKEEIPQETKVATPKEPSLKEEAPEEREEATPKEPSIKEEAPEEPKAATPKEPSLKEEAPEEPKAATPKEPSLKEEAPEEPKAATPKEPSLKEETPEEPKAATPKEPSLKEEMPESPKEPSLKDEVVAIEAAPFALELPPKIEIQPEEIEVIKEIESQIEPPEESIAKKSVSSAEQPSVKESAESAISDKVTERESFEKSPSKVSSRAESERMHKRRSTAEKTPSPKVSSSAEDLQRIPPPDEVRPCSEPSSKRPSKQPSKIPIRTPRSKLLDIKCDCPVDCQCEICSPEIMRQREAKRQTMGQEDCTCLPSCGCAVCSQHKEAPPKRTTSPIIRGHPPDCDCIDCLCDPCALICKIGSQRNVPGLRTSSKKLRKHPADCDCLDCLCDPCADDEEDEDDFLSNQPSKQRSVCDSAHPSRQGSRKMSSRVPSGKVISKESSAGILKEQSSCKISSRKASGKLASRQASEKLPSREASRQASGKIASRKTSSKLESKSSQLEKIEEHPADCDCTVCKCEPCADSKREKQKQFHPAGCTCQECFCISGKFPDEHPPGCDCLECLCKSCPDLTAKRAPEKPTEVLEKVSQISHPKGCSCAICKCPGGEHNADCNCPVCRCKKCPDVNVATSVEQGTDWLKLDNDTLTKRLVDMESENQQRREEMSELRELLQQIRCACAEAELNASQSPSKPLLEKQAASFEMTMSGLQVALAALQDKCKAKDNIIEAMTKELKLRANSKVFDDLLKNIAAKTEIANVDYDRKEVCDSLPRPLDDPAYGRPSSRLQQCQHPDAPNCPCNTEAIATISPAPIVTEITPTVKSPTCTHKDFPNCPCTRGSQITDSPPSTTKPTPPNSPKRKSEVSEDISLLGSKSQSATKQSSGEPAVSATKICNHADYPNCPCSKPSQQNESVVKVEPAVVPAVQTIEPRRYSQPKQIVRGQPRGTCSCEPDVGVDPSPMDIIEVRRVSPDSLLMKWEAPNSEHVTGYEICVDGVVKSRVFSAQRNSAVIHSLELSNVINISLYAITVAGRCQPPAVAVYQS